MNRIIPGFFCVLLFVLVGCSHKTANTNNNTQTTTPPPITSSTDIKGYNLLSKICGIWDGGVTSSTALGSYPEWIVDFRPISASQVSAKNELDTANDIFMSFFITYHNSGYKLAFRNGGSFTSLKRASYMEVDSVVENSSQSYYRFVDFVKGDKRAITEVIFKQDSLIIRSFTNKYNTLTTPVIHMEWRAKLQDATSCAAAKTAFNFPQKVLTKDFSTTFATLTESIFYQQVGDPYPEVDQPYLGKSTLSFTVAPGINLNASKHVLMVVTTQPLINNYVPNLANLIYRSRYVILNASDNSFTFNYMHPGSYYLYAFYDADGNGAVNSGDYVSTTNTAFTLADKGTVSASTQINYMIP